MKNNRTFSLFNILIFIILTVTFCVYTAGVNAQCPPGYPIDCGDGFCCPSNYPYCGGGGLCYDQPPGCPPGYPVDCGDGTCCPSSNPYCGGNGLCYDQPPNASTTTTEEPLSTTSIQVTPTTTIPGTVTTTSPSGGATTTTAGGGTAGNFLVAVNINGNDQQDAPEPTGALPGTSPSEINAYQSNMHSNKQKFYAVDRIFPPLDPDLIEKYKPKLSEELKAQEGIKINYTEGEQKSFWVKDDKDLVWRQVSAINKKSGVHCDIFVDDTINVSSDVIEFYRKEFDEIMFDIISSNFGTFVDKDNSGKVSILIYNMNEDTSQGVYTTGYFWQKDYFPDAETKPRGIRSNEMDIIYIRGTAPIFFDPAAEGIEFYQVTLTTLTHEFQHMVNFGVTVLQPPEGKWGNASVWINEMMSMAAETMYFKKKLSQNPSYTFPGMLGAGYLKSRINYYNDDPQQSIRNGHGLSFWDNQGDTIANYSLSYLFGQYLSIHSTSGDAIFKEILNYMVANTVFDFNTVSAVVSQKIPGIASWKELLKHWAVANMANEPAGLYGYKGHFVLTPHGPAADTANIHNGGAVYRTISGSVTTPAGAGSSMRFFAYANGTVTDLPLPPGASDTTTTAGGGTNTTTTTGASNCSNEYPIDCGNGYCCPQQAPYCGTGLRKGKCLTKPGLCAAKSLYEDDVETLTVLWNFRDEVLQKTDSGRNYINLFYQNSPEIISIFITDPEIKIQTAKALKEMLPYAVSIVEGDEIVIEQRLMDEIEYICDSLSAKARPALAETIMRLKKELKQGDLCNNLQINCSIAKN
jgi:hypothetical protein